MTAAEMPAFEALLLSKGHSPKGAVSRSPRLARQRLPWVNAAKAYNANGVVADIVRKEREQMGRNRVAAGDVWRTMTQGSLRGNLGLLARSPVGADQKLGSAGVVW